MEKGMITLPADDAKKTARVLTILIFDFLLDEMREETDVPKRKLLNRATDCLKKVYRIRCAEYVLPGFQNPLPDVFAIGCRPVKVMDRLKAEQYKKWGNSLMVDKSYKSAEIEYSKAIHLNPGNAVYWSNRAASRIRLESYFSAVSDCEKALKLDKSYTKALVWQGIAYALINHPRRAIRCYRRALRIEPGNEICITNLDVINRKLSPSALRVLDSLCRYGRYLASAVVNMVNNHQNIFNCIKSDGNPEEEYRKRQDYLHKFKQEALD